MIFVAPGTVLKTEGSVTRVSRLARVITKTVLIMFAALAAVRDGADASAVAFLPAELTLF